jgi:hypothetical protein
MSSSSFVDYFDGKYCGSIIVAEKSAYKQKNIAIKSTIQLEF